MTGNDKGMSFHIGETRGGFTALANVFIFSDDPNKSRSSKQLLNALESTLRSAVPLIEENYGRVIRVSANGISVAFERNAEDALAFGISICQRANASEDMAGGFGVSVGITYGKVFTSNVVCGSFSTVIAVSEAVELSNILSRACPRADASILIMPPCFAFATVSTTASKLGFAYSPKLTLHSGMFISASCHS